MCNWRKVVESLFSVKVFPTAHMSIKEIFLARKVNGLWYITDVQVATRLRTVVSLRRVQVGAWCRSPSPLVWRHHTRHTVVQNSSGRQVVWCRRTVRGFGTSCLLHRGHRTVSANSEDSWTVDRGQLTVEYRTRNQEVTGSTHIRSTASNLEQFITYCVFRPCTQLPTLSGMGNE